MGENIKDPGLLIPGWNDYVQSQAAGIEASYQTNPIEGKTRASHFLEAAESIRQVANNKIGEVGPLWKVSTLLQSRHITREQVEDLWKRAQGNEDELTRILEKLDELGEL
jgi:hypothetical protein